jgi:hypothetical protein
VLNEKKKRKEKEKKKEGSEDLLLEKKNDFANQPSVCSFLVFSLVIYPHFFYFLPLLRRDRAKKKKKVKAA